MISQCRDTLDKDNLDEQRTNQCICTAIVFLNEDNMIKAHFLGDKNAVITKR